MRSEVSLTAGLKSTSAMALMPQRASSTATALPMPLPAPVTRAVAPESSMEHSFQTAELRLRPVGQHTATVRGAAWYLLWVSGKIIAAVFAFVQFLVLLHN